jgi:hypothetical protein
VELKVAETMTQVGAAPRCHRFAVIIILASYRIVTEKIAATNHAIHHMHNCNFSGIIYLRSSHPRHHSNPNQT